MGIHYSDLNFKPTEESLRRLEFMRLMDEPYLIQSYKEARGLHIWLTLNKGFEDHRKRILFLIKSLDFIE